MTFKWIYQNVARAYYFVFLQNFLKNVLKSKCLNFILEKDFSNKKHSFDIWHGAKNLGGKIVKVWLVRFQILNGH